MSSHCGRHRPVLAAALIFTLTLLPGNLALADSALAARPPALQEFEVDWNEPAEFDLLTAAPGWRLDEVGPAEHGTAAVTSAATVQYIPAPDFTGIDTFTFKASGDGGDQVEGEVVVWVFAVTTFEPEPPGVEATVSEMPVDVPAAAPASPDVAGDEPDAATANGASGLLSGGNPWRHVIRAGLIVGAIFVYFVTRKKLPAA